MIFYLILLQDTISDGNYPLYFPLVIIPILVIAVAGHRIRKKIRLDRIRNEYRSSLNRLKAEPDNPELKRETWALGTRYVNLSKTIFGQNDFNEADLENDINSASPEKKEGGNINSDNEPIDLECGGCGKRVRQTVQWLKENRDFVCPECGTINPLNVKELLEGLAKLEDPE